MKRSNSADSSMNLFVDAAEHGRCDAEAERGVMFQSRSNSANSVIAQQCELVVRPGAVEHGRCDAETKRGLMFQSTSNSAHSNMNLSVDLAEQSASIEK